MKNVKVKIFETFKKQDLEDEINQFINEEIEDCDIMDIKFNVDPQVDPEWINVYPMYAAMVIYQ